MNALLVSSSDTAVSPLMFAAAMRGHTVTNVYDAKSALQQLALDTYDVIIIGELPGGDVEQTALCQQIRELQPYPQPAIWVIANRDRPEHILAAIDAGATSFLTLPLDAQQLRKRFTALEQVLAQIARERQPAAGPTSAEALLKELPDAVALLNSDGEFRYVSPRIEDILGYSADALIGISCISLCHPDDVSRLLQQLMLAVEHPERFATVSVRMRRAGDGWQDVELRCRDLRDDSRTSGVFMVIRDDTPRRDREQQLERQAFYDSLTGLANRSLFVEHLTQALARSSRFNRPVAVMYLDLDNFKVINDTFGHVAGDAVLAGVGQRLRSAIRANDIAARIGGDEFVLLIEDLVNEEHAHIVARRVTEALSEPLHIDGHPIRVQASLGIAFSRPGFRTPAALLREADRALYQAKARRATAGVSEEHQGGEPAGTPALSEQQQAAAASAQQEDTALDLRGAITPCTPLANAVTTPSSLSSPPGPGHPQQPRSPEALRQLGPGADLIERFRAIELQLARLIGDESR